MVKDYDDITQPSLSLSHWSVKTITEILPKPLRLEKVLVSMSLNAGETQPGEEGCSQSVSYRYILWLTAVTNLVCDTHAQTFYHVVTLTAGQCGCGRENNTVEH